jgi:hypothetical protein
MPALMTKRAKELGLKIRDAKQPLQLEVKRCDIAAAEKKNATCCGFAQACKRTMDVRNAYFFRSTAYLETDKGIVRYKLPSSMQKEIVAFDRNKTMEPGTYQLAKPSPSMGKAYRKKLDKKREQTSHRGRVTARKNRFVHKTANVREMFQPG